MLFKSTEWHEEEQWLLHAYDLDRRVDRYFAMKDISAWSKTPIHKAGARHDNNAFAKLVIDDLKARPKCALYIHSDNFHSFESEFKRVTRNIRRSHPTAEFKRGDTGANHIAFSVSIPELSRQPHSTDPST